MSQIADVKCVILNLAYLEALDILYGMECQSTSDLEKLVLYDYRDAGDCPDSDEDCCVADILRRYSYTAEDCESVADCTTNITIEPSYCGEITLSVL